MSLEDNQLFYVHNYNCVKEMWDTLEMVHGISPIFEQ